MASQKPRWLYKLIQLMKETLFDEIVLKGSGEVFGTRKQENKSLTSFELSDKEFTKELQLFSLNHGLRLDPRSPFSGGSFQENQFRWQAVIPPASTESCFFLRRHRFENLSLEDFIRDKKVYDDLMELQKSGNPFLVLGPTGSGKSSFLSAFLKEFASNKRVILLEDYEELPITSPFWMRLISRKTELNTGFSLSQRTLFAESLRLRPDVFVLGELRGSELMSFLEAASSGHQSCCSTFHAGSLEDFKQRSELILSQKALETSLWLIIMKPQEEGYGIKKIIAPPSLGLEKKEIDSEGKLG